MKLLVLILDLAGTFVFALSGATEGIRRRLDLFGVLVLSFVAATAGGMTRDVLLGATPPAALRDWTYLAVSAVAGVIGFFWHPIIVRLRSPVLMFDAAGLALFAVSGAQKALGYGIHPAIAAVLGMVTGIGGGVLRDVLIMQIPTVLRAELYAVAALAGATIVVAGHVLGVPAVIATSLGAVVCFALRVGAIHRNWRLPTATISRSLGTGPKDDGPGADK